MQVSEATETVHEDAVLLNNKPIHMAKCAECPSSVRFQSISPSAFFVVDGDADVTFGVGDNGLPVCPNGHGEMSIADDRMVPAAEAFTLAQEQLEGPAQRSLPGVFPPFNFEGAYLELERQALTVDSLHKAHKAAAEEARDAKKAWDSAAELYTTMALELRRRRREKVGEPQDDADRQAAAAAGVEPTPRCTWEAKRTDGEACPICSGATIPIVVAQYLGDPERLAQPDAQEHVADVNRMLIAMEIDEVIEALENIDTFITADVIATWTPEARKAVTLWADAVLDKISNVPDTIVPDRPDVLGRPHAPAIAVEGEHQVCQVCEVVIRAASDEHDPFKDTDAVGVDCQGKPQHEAPRYPETKRNKAKAKGGKKK